MDYDKEAVRRAVVFLIESDDAAHACDTLTRLIPLARATPLQLTGEYEQLNVLIDIGRRSPESFDRLIALVDRKRREDLKAP